MKTPSKSPTGSNDGPEEGEIVSDDLEDISDESMIFTPNGKSLSRSDHLHALSLSSVTELDEPPTEKRRKRRKSYSERHARRQKKRRKTVDSDSSDNDTTIDKRFKLQLKAAVRVDVEEAHKNSLKTRLKAMVQKDSGSNFESFKLKQKKEQINLNNTDASITVIDLVEQDTSNCIEILASSSENAASAPEDIESATEPSTGDANDSELMFLRIEALKTAIKNRCANRKRKKKENSELATSDDTNKENTSNNLEENQNTKTTAVENKTEQPHIAPQENDGVDNNTPPSPEEDEDVLRALLLASMSKKITKTQPEPSKLIVNNKAESKISAMNPNKMKNNHFKLNNNVKWMLNDINKGVTKFIKVKPLIINVNSDSDSDWDLSNSPEKSPKKTQSNSNFVDIKNKDTVIENSINAVSNDIESTVEKFLREQRAKVESEISTVSIPNKVNNKPENKTTILPAINITSKPQITPNTLSNFKKVTPNTTPEKPKIQKVVKLEKSALKFLPASKREEYQKLQNLLRLKQAQKKRPRIRRLSQRAVDNGNNLKLTVINQNIRTEQKNIQKNSTLLTETNLNNVAQKDDTHSLISKNSECEIRAKQSDTSNSVKKAVHNVSTQIFELGHVQLPPQIEARIAEFRQEEIKASERRQELIRESMEMRNTLKQLQTKKDGRLQIQDKYKCLRPLVKKLNTASKEQKLCEQEVERLLGELRKTRERQEMLHRQISIAIKELYEEKRKVDLSQSNQPKTVSVPVTSTPIKPSNAAASIALSSLFSSSTLGSESTDLTSEKGVKAGKDVSINMLDTWEQSTICNNPSEPSNDCKETEITVVDPNDIDKIIKKTEEKMAMLEQKDLICKKSDKVRYVSPLDAGQRKDGLDPFEIVCPFEVNGTCKDPDCQYNHLSK